MSLPYTNPSLLKVKAQKQHLKVFLCGPGFSEGPENIRTKVKDHFTKLKGVESIYGEDVEKRIATKRGADLQTLEAQFAHETDFTLLLLESPGSLAELGTFSMIANVRPRLFILVPKIYYRADSYIARGPLSLIAGSHPNNVIYYDSQDLSDLFSRVDLPVQMYKYIYSQNPYLFADARNAVRMRDQGYWNIFSPKIEAYFAAVVLISILCEELPTFAGIVASTHIAPSTVHGALRFLFNAKKIKKSGGGRYEPIVGFKDALLFPFNTMKTSQTKAKLIATA